MKKLLFFVVAVASTITVHAAPDLISWDGASSNKPILKMIQSTDQTPVSPAIQKSVEPEKPAAEQPAGEEDLDLKNAQRFVALLRSIDQGNIIDKEELAWANDFFKKKRAERLDPAAWKSLRPIFREQVVEWTAFCSKPAAKNNVKGACLKYGKLGIVLTDPSKIEENTDKVLQISYENTQKTMKNTQETLSKAKTE